MERKEIIHAFAIAGQQLNELLHIFFDDENKEFIQVMHKALQLNPWFTIEEQKRAMSAIVQMLDEEKLTSWLEQYPGKITKPKNIGVIMAGNIPLVGFHDLLCVLLSGNCVIAKCSADDNVLLPWFCKLLIQIDDRFDERIAFVERIVNPDAIIATGSNNSARYFEYYFGKYPHIIRKNRNGLAVLSGNESTEELQLLGTDIFSYFGMGCRNVSKLFVPEKYDFNNFFEAMEKFSGVLQHNKYMNNYDYHAALLLMNLEKFLTNNFMIIKEGRSNATAVSVINYEYYHDAEKLKQQLHKEEAEIQCIIGNSDPEWIPFGKSQQPGLTDYADGVDTMQFLTGLD